jgi:hypothetical protein
MPRRATPGGGGGRHPTDEPWLRNDPEGAKRSRCRDQPCPRRHHGAHRRAPLLRLWRW